MFDPFRDPQATLYVGASMTSTVLTIPSCNEGLHTVAIHIRDILTTSSRLPMQLELFKPIAE